MKKNRIKRITFITMLIVVSIVYANSEKTNRNIGDAVQVTSLPISGKVVILDAGHPEYFLTR